MTWLQVLGTITTLALAIFKMWAEQNNVKKQTIKEGVQTVIDGIEAKDVSKITAGFDTINRA